MISFIRKMATSWIVLALLGLVIVAFIVTGIGDPFGGGPAATTVAEVAGDEISDIQLSNQFDRQLQTIRQEQPGVTAKQAIDGGALDGVLERLIGSQALIAMGERLGLAASKRQVDAEIASIPAFRGPDGRFSEMTFREVLRAQGLDETLIRREIGGDVVRRQLLKLVDDPSITPRTMAEPYAALQLERRTLVITAVPAARFSDMPPPADAEIEAYYRANIARFTIPEQRRITYALIDRAEIAAQAEVSEAAIADYYKRNAKAFEASERRALSQIVLQSRADAETAAKRIAAGEPFVDVAAGFGFGADDLELGVLGKAEFAATVSTRVADAAFAVAEGAVTQPVQSDFGWHVVRVDRIEKQSARTLADVRDEIIPLVRREVVENRVADLVNKADEELADGASLAEVAQDLGLAVVKLPPVTSEGMTRAVADIRLEERVRPLIERAFTYDPNEEPVVEDISDELHALINVEEIIAPTPLPIDEVKPQLTAALRFERQMAAAKTMAEAIASGLREGKPAAGLARERGLPAPQSLSARRIEIRTDQGPVPPPISLGFALSEGEVRTIPQPRNGAWYVVQVASVTPGNVAEAPALVDSLRPQLREAATGEYAQNFVAAIMNDVGVKRYPNAMDRLKTRYAGGEPAL